MQEYFQIGTIIGAHGIKGELKIRPSVNTPERFLALRNVLISDSRISDNGFEPRKLLGKAVANPRIHGTCVLVSFEGVNDRTEAEKYIGKTVVVERKNAIELDEDEYFIADIIGCKVFDIHRGYLGEVSDVLQTGSNDVYIVQGGKYGEVLIPVIKEVVLEIDPAEGRITADLPEGLINE